MAGFVQKFHYNQAQPHGVESDYAENWQVNVPLRVKVPVQRHLGKGGATLMRAGYGRPLPHHSNFSRSVPLAFQPQYRSPNRW